MLRFDDGEILSLLFFVCAKKKSKIFLYEIYIRIFTHKYQRLINSIDNVGSMEFFRGRKIDNLIFRISGSPL